MHGLIATGCSTVARTASTALVFLLAACAVVPPVGDVPSSVATPQMPVGRSWAYQIRDGYNHGLLRTLRYTVAGIQEGIVTLRVDDVQAGVASRATETAGEEPLQ